MTRTIELASGALRAAIVPDLGGCVAGLWLGGLIDTHFNTKPWIAIGGIVVGTIVGFYNLIRLLNRYSNNND